MKNKLIGIAKDTNLFLKKFIMKQKKQNLFQPWSMVYFQEEKKLDQKFY